MKITCFADTHRCVNGLDMPKTDVLICAGDFCNSGNLEDLIAFNSWFSLLPSKHKILVAGNHDICLEHSPALARTFLDKDIIYLQDEGIEIDGVKFYGSPWQLPFMDWAFNLSEEELEKKFELIPNDIDVLISHSPPYGILDSIPTKKYLGSKSLLNRVLKIKPHFHIFGHIHHGYGKYADKDRGTTFINASLLDEGYKFVNKPVVFEL